MKTPIYVTQPNLPPLNEFIPYLEKIWESKTLTNGGVFHQSLEKALCDYLGVKYISLFTNGTIALISAMQALKISGEVITTPYSFVATSHSILWNGLKPVFVDIDPETLNMDPSKIEAAITSETSAILPVHCYGYPCDVDAIQKIADKHTLKVIYDAAHAFGVENDSGSILNYGDLSILSFHATKVFNTFEGGAIVSPDAETKGIVDQLKNFGFISEMEIDVVGINGKMSEINAAFGLLQLRHMDSALLDRKEVDIFYRKLLNDLQGIRCLDNLGNGQANYSYFPIMIEDTYPISRDDLYEKLKAKNIFARRYFFPLISQFEMYKKYSSADPGNLPVATLAANKILCLPIYPSLKQEEQQLVVDLIRNA